MRAWIRRLTRSRSAAVASALGLLLASPGAAQAVEPPSPLGIGSVNSIINGKNAVDNQVFWNASDFHSPAKLTVSFNTTPSNGVPTPYLLVVGVLPNGQQFVGDIPTVYSETDSPPAWNSAAGSVAWVPSRNAFHMVVNAVPVSALVSGQLFPNGTSSGIVSADLWFTGYPGGATEPANWDGQTSYWEQAIAGNGKANGTISFPDGTTVTVNQWGAEEETEYGTFELGPGPEPYTGVNHIGYDYEESDNPDGSENALDVFPEKDGTWRGLFVETSATGVVTECEPSEPGDIQLSNWVTDTVTGLKYPLTVSAHCGSISMTWNTTKANTGVPVVSLPLDGFLTSDSSTTSSVPGSTGVAQHLRDIGSFGETPNF